MSSDEIEKCRIIADYQFGAGAGRAIFPSLNPSDYEFKRSTSGRISQVFTDGEEKNSSDAEEGEDGVRLVTLKNGGRFTLGDEAGRRLHASFDAPRVRVEFNEDSVPFLEDGKNGFAKFVTRVDDSVRDRDEVVVTGPGDEFVTTGRAELCAREMRDFDRGIAVLVR